VITPPTIADIEEGCREMATLYPWMPSMILWRGWEQAAYRRFSLVEPVLDVGCGDGRFFRHVFPSIRDVVGVELDADVAQAAMASGVYRAVYRIAADALPASDERFGSAFANCSLEHMDHLADVLQGIRASLRPGAPFLCSVVTERFVQWSPLPIVVAASGDPALGRKVQREHELYHHLTNPLPRADWRSAFLEAGFQVEAELPIVPELTARLFLAIDQFVHLPAEHGEWHGPLSESLQRFPAFHDGFVRILGDLLTMETNWDDTLGMVFWLRRG
jgi:SAM-dependent methyltransferase